VELWLYVTVPYSILLVLAYLFLRIKIIKDMVKRRIMTPTSAKDVTHILDYIFMIMLIVGDFVGYLSPQVLAFLLSALLITTPFLLWDVVRSIVHYYIITSTKIVNVGNFVILTRGVRGWIKRITPFFVELRGEYEETIRVPNSLVAMELVRIPSRSLPFTLTVRFYGVNDFNAIEEALKDAVVYTKKFSVAEPKIKVRGVGNDWIEYELTYGLRNYEVTNDIMKLLANKLGKLVEGVKFEIRREHSLMVK